VRLFDGAPQMKDMFVRVGVRVRIGDVLCCLASCVFRLAMRGKHHIFCLWWRVGENF